MVNVPNYDSIESALPKDAQARIEALLGYMRKFKPIHEQARTLYLELQEEYNKAGKATALVKSKQAALQSGVAQHLSASEIGHALNELAGSLVQAIHHESTIHQQHLDARKIAVDAGAFVTQCNMQIRRAQSLIVRQEEEREQREANRQLYLDRKSVSDAQFERQAKARKIKLDHSNAERDSVAAWLFSLGEDQPAPPAAPVDVSQRPKSAHKPKPRPKRDYRANAGGES